MINQAAQRSVLVMGGGLGGLALAQGLTRAGWKVRVFERDAAPNSRAQGFRISIDPLGFGALKAVLTPDHFERVSAQETKGVGRGFAFADAGTLKARYAIPNLQDGSATLSRPGLRAVLAEGIAVEWGKRVVSFADVGTQVEARFADGSSAKADLLVGADGVGSSIREHMSQVQSGSLPVIVPAGYSSVGGTLSRSAAWQARLPLCGDGAVQFIGPEGHAMFVSFCEAENGAPVILWALSCAASKRTEAWEQQAAQPLGQVALWQECRKAVQHPGWHPVLRELVETTLTSHIIEPLLLRSTQFPATRKTTLWPSGRVTLLGDAAHTMLPQRGVGGNTALADAQLLVASLVSVGTGTLGEAVRLYERAMLARGKQQVQDSEEACALLHYRNPVAKAARWAGFCVMRLLQRRPHLNSAALTA